MTGDHTQLSPAPVCEASLLESHGTELNSVLIVSDNYWIGGRETFLEDAVYLMREMGVRTISLIAQSIRNSSVAQTFDHAVEVGLKHDIEFWLQQGQELVERKSVQLIWAHHYSLLPALLLADMLKLPLHITIHGPIMTTAGLNRADAIGFAVAASSGASFSGVSQEIIKQLQPFSQQTDIWGVFPNKVRVSRPDSFASDQTKNRGKSRSIKQVIRFAVFSRQDKLDHIRQSVLLTYAFHRLGHSVALDIYTGITESTGIANHTSSQFRRLSALLGRKWLVKNLGLLRFMRHVRLKPLVQDVPSQIRSYDAIMAMGRVSLEAIANMRVSILIGYKRPIGVINKSVFREYQSTNFSGRMIAYNSFKKIVSDTIDSLNAHENTLLELSEMVDIENARAPLRSLLNHASNTKSIDIQKQEIKQLMMKNSNFLDSKVFFLGFSLLERHEKELARAVCQNKFEHQTAGQTEK